MSLRMVHLTTLTLCYVYTRRRLKVGHVVYVAGVGSSRIYFLLVDLAGWGVNTFNIWKICPCDRVQKFVSGAA